MQFNSPNKKLPLSLETKSEKFNAKLKCKQHDEEYVAIEVTSGTNGILKCPQCIAEMDDMSTLRPVKQMIHEMKFLPKISDLKSDNFLDNYEKKADQYEMENENILNIITKSKDDLNSILREYLERVVSMFVDKKSHLFNMWDEQYGSLKSNISTFKEKLKEIREKIQEEDSEKKSIDQYVSIISESESHEEVESTLNKFYSQYLFHSKNKNENPHYLKTGLDRVSSIIKTQEIETFKFLDSSFKYFINLLEVLREALDAFTNTDLIEVPFTPIINEIPTFEMDSAIIKSYSYESLISGWIDPVKNIKLTCLYRGSRDGFEYDDYYNRCIDEIPTLTLIRSNMKRIFGGYTNINWKTTNNFKYSEDSWLFSLDERVKFPLIRPEYAVVTYKGFLPTFGGGYDLHICENCNITKCSYSKIGHSYSAGQWTNQSERLTILAGSQNFFVEEIEVFRVEIF